jgi:type II secretory pathway pseudopilin PulG
MASLWAIVTLVLLGVLLALITTQFLAVRRLVAHREQQVQAMWLARSGLELAATRLQAGTAGYKGETVEILPGSSVLIDVKKDSRVPNTYLITSEARYPADGTDRVVRSLTRHVRRVSGKDGARLEIVTALEADKLGVTPVARPARSR